LELTWLCPAAAGSFPAGAQRSGEPWRCRLCLPALCCWQLYANRLLCQVMCDAYEPPRDTADGKHIADMKPIPTNTRHACAVAMEKAAKEEPWFGIEQVRQQH
jgi:hypothetical protein